jgi:hypothetical protein
VQASFDDVAFNRALSEYVALNRRDLPTLLNNKAKDLMFRAARGVPKARTAEIRALMDNWPLRTWLGGKAGAKTREDRAEASRKIIWGRIRSVGFVRGGFVKAGRQIKATMDARPGMEPDPGAGSNRNPNARARVSPARPGPRPELSYLITWKMRSRSEAGQMQMLQAGLRAASRSVQADMMIYIRRKMRERGRALGLAVKSAGGAI